MVLNVTTEITSEVTLIKNSHEATMMCLRVGRWFRVVGVVGGSELAACGRSHLPSTST